MFLVDYCKSNIPGSNKKCLTRAEVGKLSARMIDGSPCFSPVDNEGVSFDYNQYNFLCNIHILQSSRYTNNKIWKKHELITDMLCIKRWKDGNLFMRKQTLWLRS